MKAPDDIASAAPGDTPAAPDTLDCVLFSAGNWRFGIEACRVAGCHARPTPDDDAAAVETMLGLPPPGRQAAVACRELQIRSVVGEEPAVRTLCIHGDVDLVAVPVARIHPLPPLLAARQTIPGACALISPAGDDGQVIVLLNRL